jgi:hypothetical protein
MEAQRSLETLIATYQSTGTNNIEDQNVILKVFAPRGQV